MVPRYTIAAAASRRRAEAPPATYTKRLPALVATSSTARTGAMPSMGAIPAGLLTPAICAVRADQIIPAAHMKAAAARLRGMV